MADRGRGKNPPTAHDSPRALLDALPHGPVESSTGTVELRRERDDPTGVTVVVNGVPSSHLYLANPRRLEFEYMQQMAAILDTWDVPGGPTAPLRAVHLGAAGCSMVRYLDATRPNSRNIAVEIDARLTELVRAWFQLPRAPALRLRTGDARVTGSEPEGRGAWKLEPGPHELGEPSIDLDCDVPGVRPGGIEVPNHRATGGAEVNCAQWRSRAAGHVPRVEDRGHLLHVLELEPARVREVEVRARNAVDDNRHAGGIVALSA